MNSVQEPITLIAPLGAPEHRPRLEKTIRLAERREIPVDFWGWKRNEADSLGASLPAIAMRRCLLKVSGHRTRRVRILYPLWTIIVFFNVLFRGPKRIFALGLETAVGVWAATRVRGGNYIFDDADRLVMMVNLPGPLDRFIRMLERAVSRASAAHVVPGLERYEYRTPKMHLIPNTPDERLLAQARDVRVERPDADLVVYVNGWLHEGRGVGWIRRVAETVRPEDRIHFIIAGELLDGEAQALAALPCSTAFGEIPQHEALAWYRVADVVATFYNHVMAPNAVANKWGDAVFTGVPILMNSEVVAGRPYVDAGAAFEVSYDDDQGLYLLLKTLARDSSHLERARAAIDMLRGTSQFYDEGMSKALGALFHSSRSGATDAAPAL